MDDLLLIVGAEDGVPAWGVGGAALAAPRTLELKASLGSDRKK